MKAQTNHLDGVLRAVIGILILVFRAVLLRVDTVRNAAYAVSRGRGQIFDDVAALGVALLVAFALATLSGCVGLPFNAAELEPAQIKALAADKNTLARCYRVPTPYGTVSAVVVLVDKDSQPQGRVQIDPDCKTTIQNGKE